MEVKNGERRPREEKSGRADEKDRKMKIEQGGWKKEWKERSRQAT